MDPSLVLFILRLLSALLLLGFLLVIAWLIYHDMRLTSNLLEDQHRQFGVLRVIANDAEAPAVDTKYPLRPITSIGRARSNNVVLANGYTSSEHALITRRGQQWWLEDVGSRNGTLLNEMKLSEATVISPGDVITIGSTQLKVEL